MEQVRRQQDRGSGPRARDNGRPHPLDSNWIETGQRLVEQQRRRVSDQGARDDDLLSHATRELARKCVFLPGKLELRQQPRRTPVDVRNSVEAADESQMFRHCQVVEQMRFIRHERQATFRLDGRCNDVVFIDAYDRTWV